MGRLTFHFSCHTSALSVRMTLRKVAFCRARKARAAARASASSGGSTLTETTAKPRRLYFSCSATTFGNFSLHGAERAPDVHQDDLSLQCLSVRLASSEYDTASRRMAGGSAVSGRGESPRARASIDRIRASSRKSLPNSSRKGRCGEDESHDHRRRLREHRLDVSNATASAAGRDGVWQQLTSKDSAAKGPTRRSRRRGSVRRVAFVGKVGADDFGRAIRDQLVREGIDVTYLGTDPDRPTGTAAILVDDARRERDRRRARGESWPDARRRPIGRESCCGRVRIVLAPCETMIETLTEAFRIAHAAGVRCACSTQRRLASCPTGCSEHRHVRPERDRRFATVDRAIDRFIG